VSHGLHAETVSGSYNPNCEATNGEKVVAGHWELLRRNKEFRALSARWLKSEEFRRFHALSPNYHDMQNHTPRCAWDWMLTAAQRVRLAKFQIENLRWLLDDNFNFGPIICRENFPPAKVTKKNWRKFLQVEPLPNPPPPITVSQSWNCTPDLFKQQFRRAYASPNEFGEINARFQEHGKFLANAASRLGAGDPHNEASVIADYLFTLGSELRDLAEFSKVFKIPKCRYSEKRFKSFLGQIHDSFKASNLLLPTKTYDTHESYQGTTEDWLWFLEAERLDLDIRKSADCYKLAEIYSEKLRQRAMRGKAPRRAKAHGHTGSKFSSKVIKNRRSVVKQHVRTIEKWILAAYPRQTPGPDVTAS
jgi:hypothetical protein